MDVYSSDEDIEQAAMEDLAAARQPCQVSLLNTKMSDSISFKFTVCVKGCKNR